VNVTLTWLLTIVDFDPPSLGDPLGGMMTPSQRQIGLVQVRHNSLQYSKFIAVQMELCERNNHCKQDTIAYNRAERTSNNNYYYTKSFLTD